MKKYIIFIASAVLMMTACVKEEINTTITGETEFISVELNAATKTQLSGTITNWTPGDKVSVTVDGKNLGSLTLVEGNIFAGEIESVGLDGKLSATINYPADVTAVPEEQKAVASSFAEKAALLEGTTTLAELRKGNGAELANKTALLKFTVAKAGDVTFEVGTKKYTVTGCQTGSTYYACVEPATAKLVARIGGYLSRATSASKTFTAGNIADLGALPAPEASDFSIQGIDGNWSSNVKMYKDIYWNVALNVKSTTSDFKFTKGTEWIGAKSEFVHKDVYAYPKGDSNIKITPNTAYDIYYNHDGGLYMVLPAGTDINKDIYVATDMFIRGNYTNYTGYGNWGKGKTPIVAQGKYYLFKNYKFTAVPEFKFTTSEEGWNWQYSSETTLKLNTWTTLKSGASLGSNTKYATAGTYDIYTTSDKNSRNKVLIVKTGDVPASL